MWQKCKILIVLVLAALLAFGFGYLAGLEAGQGKGIDVETSPFVDASSTGQVVASKTGTKYFLAWCGTVDRISESNKIWFSSAAAAEAAGYSAAENCAGL